MPRRPISRKSLECLGRRSSCRKERNSAGNDVVNNGNANDGWTNRTLDLVVFQDSNNDQTQQCQQSGQRSGHELTVGHCTVEVIELNQGVLVCLDDANILEADESDEQTDTAGIAFFRQSGRAFATLERRPVREDQEHNAGHQNDDQTLPDSLQSDRR